MVSNVCLANLQQVVDTANISIGQNKSKYVSLPCPISTIFMFNRTTLDSSTQPTKTCVFTGLQHRSNQQLRPTYRGIDSRLL